MNKVMFRKKCAAIFLYLFMSLFVMPVATADGVFSSREKSKHDLSGVELNKIKAEHQIKFGGQVSRSYIPGATPWDKKKSQQAQSKSASWSECRNYALHKRNRCYRDGRDAYYCEKTYDARVKLCDELL